MKRFISKYSLQESDKYLSVKILIVLLKKKKDISHEKFAEIINYLDLVDTGI